MESIKNVDEIFIVQTLVNTEEYSQLKNIVNELVSSTTDPLQRVTLRRRLLIHLFVDEN